MSYEHIAETKAKRDVRDAIPMKGKRGPKRKSSAPLAAETKKSRKSEMEVAEGEIEALRTFEKDRSSFIGKLDPLQLFVKVLMVMRITDSIYSPDPLRDALIELFGPDVRLFS